MKKILCFIYFSYCTLLMISCTCNSTDCAPPSILFLDVQDSLTKESLIFGQNSLFRLSDVNVFSMDGGSMRDLSKVASKNLSISPDSLVLVQLSSSISDNTIFFRSDSITADTLMLFTSSIPSADCCDAYSALDSIKVHNISYLPNEVIVFYR